VEITSVIEQGASRQRLQRTRQVADNREIIVIFSQLREGKGRSTCGSSTTASSLRTASLSS
jgi:hypothetical protein